MGDNNDHCDRCERQPHYDGHEPWCDAIRELERRIEALEARVDIDVKVDEG